MSVGIITAAKLTAIWLWFVAQLGAPPCLTAPNFIIMPQPPGTIWYGSSSGDDVRVSERAPAWMVIHELAHHYDGVCRVPERPVGRSFAHRMGADIGLWWEHPDYMQRPAEHFAGTMNWLLTGHRDWGLTETDPAVYRPLVRRLFPGYDPDTRGVEFRDLLSELRTLPGGEPGGVGVGP